MSADGERWFLCNASPDVREQLAHLPAPEPPSHASRCMPVHGLVVTDAELDHTLGIPLLRESGALTLYATPAVQRTLECESCLLPITRAFAEVVVQELTPGRETALTYEDGTNSGLAVRPFIVPGNAPRFADGAHPDHTVGLLIRDRRTGGSCAFVPGCGALDHALLRRLATVDLLLFDGTCWTDDELVALGAGTRTARAMGHVPISGDDGSLALLASLPCRTTVYTHINNTNPMLIEDSPQRAAVEDAGISVGMDGMQFGI